MNWNSHEFIWIDWVIIVVGILAVTWAVWRSIQKDKRLQQGANSEDSRKNDQADSTKPEWQSEKTFHEDTSGKCCYADFG